jgi:hypothetical protein
VKPLITETWECRECGNVAPCRLRITYTLTSDQWIDEQDHFRRRDVCVCQEKDDPEWRLLGKTQDGEVLQQLARLVDV